MTTDLTGRVRFSLFAPADLLEDRGCRHVARWLDDGTVLPPVPGCRTCYIEDHFWQAIDHGHIVDWEIHQGVHAEFGLEGRTYTGWYVGDAGRLAVQRVIAWLYAHPDPLDLAAGRLAHV